MPRYLLQLAISWILTKQIIYVLIDACIIFFYLKVVCKK